MPKSLVIVESPAKAKTIEKYLGSEYTVASSYGHIRDLPGSNISIDTDNNYEPTYVVPKEKKDVVDKLKKLAKSVEEVILATDEDREGEAISWHLCHVLELDPKTTKRIAYREITKTAIVKAMEEPRRINLDLVNAQQARRVLDRLVGYNLSPLLWRKVKPSLSAGRVQSVAVRLIVEREKEIDQFEYKNFYRIVAEFNVKSDQGNAILKAELPKRLQTEEEALNLLNDCISGEFTIRDIQKKPGKKSPSPPFTTSTLQQEASRKLGYSVAQTMVLAQRLYEAGHITYMRTDSVNLSNEAINNAAESIEKNYGSEYSESRQYTSKSSSAQEAHEAIRPTNMDLKSPDVESDQKRLYDLIWKRMIASQMANAQIEKTDVDIDISTSDHSLKAHGEVVVFDGFLKVYREGSDEESDTETQGMLPPLSVGQTLPLIFMTATERFTKPPARFTEASLVRKLEDLGIGRPSTYAPTISTIQRRGYVEKGISEGKERNYAFMKLEDGKVSQSTETERHGSNKGKLVPTDIGIVVNDFLVQHFDDILDYKFTAGVEEEFDKIALGKTEWNKMIDTFYQPFHDNIEDTMKNAERAKGEREVGIHPESGEKVIAKIGKYGPMIQIGEFDPDDESKKPQFARLRKDQHIASISLEEALELFKLPRTLGNFEETEVKVSIGRYGPYILHDSKFISLGKDHDPYTVDLPTTIELIKAKREADAKKHIKTFEEEGIQILNGRYGPYIKKEKTNYPIPKDKKENAEALTLEECQEIIANAPEKKGRRKRK